MADANEDNLPTEEQDYGNEPAASASYKGKFGTLKTNIVSTYGMVGTGLRMAGAPSDGYLFMVQAEPCADAWIAAGRADPRVMRVLKLVWGSPLMLVMAAHTPIVMGMMANHGIPISKLFLPVDLGALRANKSGKPGTLSTPKGGSEPARDQSPQEAEYPYPPLPVQPVGPYAPTEDKGPPPMTPEDGLRVLPDGDGELPADVEVWIRQQAQANGVPYQELRDAAILQVAQYRMGLQQKVTKPGTLGNPVLKREGI